jgi:uncharacterized protein YbjT (DUF2867 family)
MYAVAGVTGKTGSVVADELLRRGKKVRVIVRSADKGAPWAAKGAEVAVASLDDADALTRALEGVEGAYLLSPPDASSNDMIARGRQLGDAFAAAIRNSGVKNVVFLSSVGAQHDSGNGPIASLHEIENRLRPLGINVTFLRPAYFLENWGASVGASTQSGLFPSFIPADYSFPQIASHDIGVAAADALEHPSSGERVLDLSGPREFTPAEVAAEVSQLLGKEVTVAAAPLDAVVPTFTSFGMSQHMSELYREMYEGILNGKVARDGKGERKQGNTQPSQVFTPMLQQ